MLLTTRIIIYERVRLRARPKRKDVRTRRGVGDGVQQAFQPTAAMEAQMCFWICVGEQSPTRQTWWIILLLMLLKKNLLTC